MLGPNRVWSLTCLSLLLLGRVSGGQGVEQGSWQRDTPSTEALGIRRALKQDSTVVSEEDKYDADYDQTLGASAEEFDEGPMDDTDITLPEPTEILKTFDTTQGATSEANPVEEGLVAGASGQTAVREENEKGTGGSGTHAQVKGTPAQQSRGADKGSETANEQPEEKEIPTLPQTTVEDNPSANESSGASDPLPQPKNTTANKAIGLSEKGSEATEEEEDTLEALDDMQQKPVGAVALDTTLASEKAKEDARLEETGGASKAKQDAADLASVSDDGTEGLTDLASATTSSQQTKAAESEPASAKQNTEEQLYGSTLEGEDYEDYEAGAYEEEEAADNTRSAEGLSESSSSSNSSVLTTGVAIGSAITDMVKDNSSGIAGVAAAFLAALIGISVVGAGIALYKQFRGKRGSKPAQRVIEIGGLAQGAHATKSPSYSRVGQQNDDTEGSSGARWQDWDEKWEGGSPGGAHNRATAGKQKRAWDWDADW